MATTHNLHKARGQKKDEFYTQLSDIERELKHYKRYFHGKTIYCNCDDPRVSNFFRYFQLNFKKLRLKRLITTCYKNQNPDFFSQHDQKISVGLEIAERERERERERIPRSRKFRLKGDGDFRSEECINLLKQADIVVTNPPFSLFREYVAQLIEYNKKFLIIGHQNAVTYKEVFPLVKNNKIWLGQGFKGGATHFIAPNYKDYASATDRKEGMVRVSGVVWFTNMNHDKRREELILYKTYSSAEYPKYDNHNIINVDKTKEIPKDYEGVMGVPITFLDKYNPEQFEILGIANSARWIGYKCLTIINGEKIYNRIIIRKKR